MKGENTIFLATKVSRNMSKHEEGFIYRNRRRVAKRSWSSGGKLTRNSFWLDSTRSGMSLADS
jgi:hypothetical protein